MAVFFLVSDRTGAAEHRIVSAHNGLDCPCLPVAFIDEDGDFVIRHTWMPWLRPTMMAKKSELECDSSID